MHNAKTRLLILAEKTRDGAKQLEASAAEREALAASERKQAAEEHRVANDLFTAAEKMTERKRRK